MHAHVKIEELSVSTGTLIFLSGKMGAGKSTLSVQLAQKYVAVLISEDEWLGSLYPAEIESFEDYLRYSSRLKPILKKHVQDILRSGVSVVMDFPANTKGQRSWFADLYAGCGATHKLVYVKASDELCLSHLQMRRETHPERAGFDTEAVFRQVTSYFQPPSNEEGFNVEVVERANA